MLRVRRRKLRLTNVMAFSSAILAACNALIFSVYQRSDLLTVSTVMAVLFITVPFVNRVGQYDAGRVLFILTANMGTYLWNSMLGTDANVYLFFIACTGFPFLIFELEEKGKILFSMLVPLGFFVLKDAMLEEFMLKNPNRELINWESELFHYATMGFVALQIYYMHRLDKNHEIKVERSVRELTISERSVRTQQAHVISTAKMSSMSELTGNISHEITSDFKIIALAADNIEKIAESTNINPVELYKSYTLLKSALDRASKSIKRMHLLIRDTDLRPIQMKNLVEECAEFCRQRFKDHKISLEVGNTCNVLVDGRAALLAQCIINLLTNAREAIFGTDGAWVRMDMKVSGKTLAITVTDSGKGIPAHIVQKMMDPFFTTREIEKKSGLGLTISKEIIQEHGGLLSYNSNSPNTSFIIELPISSATSEKL